MEPVNKSRGKGLGPQLVLGIFSIVLALLVGEFALRAIDFRMPSILPPDVRHTYGEGPYAGFVYRGYLPGTFEDFENPVQFNQYGMHDFDYQAKRPTSSTYRITVLGDSYVAALSVPLDQTFHKLLQEQLRREDPLHCGSYEVMALGHGHRAQEAELQWLKDVGRIFKPDAVALLFFCGNDIMENSSNLDARATAFGEYYASNVIPRKLSMFSRLLLFPHSRMNGILAETYTTWYASHLYRLVPGITREQLESPELGVYHRPLEAEWQAAFARTGVLLGQIRDATHAIGADFWIVGLEGPQAIGDVSEHELWDANERAIDFDQPFRWLEDWCAANDVPLCNPNVALAKAGIRRVFWRHDGHLNPYGNKVLARYMYPFMTNRAERLIAQHRTTNQASTPEFTGTVKGGS